MKKIILALVILKTMSMAEDQALIVGCCSEYKYEGIPILKGTKNDARHIRELLISRGVKSNNIDYLVEKEASYSNISKKMKAKESSGLKKGDTLYVYYSGHGTSLGNSSAFTDKLADNPNILERLNNSAGLITYDFDNDNPEKTLIITSRDFKPTFKMLDDKGVNIVWIADACYAGNAYRSGNKSEAKFVKLNKKSSSWTPPKGNVRYENLLFYGASVSTITTTEIDYKGEARGAFSVELEKCLNAKYDSRNISNKALKKCLAKNYEKFTFESSVYPMDSRLDGKKVMVAAKVPTLQNHTKKRTFREKLFALQDDRDALKLNIYSEYRPQIAIDTFCQGEVLNIDLLNAKTNVMAVTMDSNDKVIMIYPNQSTKRHHTLKQIIQMEVQDPVGTDKVKVFAIDDAQVYDTVFSYKDKQEGILSSADVENIYNALVKSKKFSSAFVKIETISTPIEECRKGDM